MSRIHYWAGGFGNKWMTKAAQEKKLQEFINGEYWQALYYSIADKSSTATNARVIFSQIAIGDKFLIKGYGGKHNIAVHFAGEVIAKDKENYRLDLKKEDIVLYRGDAPVDKAQVYGLIGY